MKYKSDKSKFEWDEEVLDYTSRRIREMAGNGHTTYYDDRPTHPYIRRRLDEIKKEAQKNSSEDS